MWFYSHLSSEALLPTADHVKNLPIFSKVYKTLGRRKQNKKIKKKCKKNRMKSISCHWETETNKSMSHQSKKPYDLKIINLKLDLSFHFSNLLTLHVWAFFITNGLFLYLKAAIWKSTVRTPIIARWSFENQYVNI